MQEQVATYLCEVHDIEPYFNWIAEYQASRDEASPFYGRTYDEFRFHQKVYNYYIHPQWDEFGSPTLYAKILYVDYDASYAIIELIGEWNDCIHNDIMHLKRNVIDTLMTSEISKYVLIAENVMNFHADEDDYYAEWYEEVAEENGFVCLLSPHPHVKQEMESIYIDRYIRMGEQLDDINWRRYKPMNLMKEIEQRLDNQITRIG